ncbi:hypothetical protein [Microbulbifer taiwanensis]|uniref:Anti-sigma factor n=1 Tax=Microbulbifer taiwanensis TaxID=986746 RepID=A0ABW1YNB5_9GAMM|nr:hypothetical protein [Microbulbifer taiwanensis]
MKPRREFAQDEDARLVALLRTLPAPEPGAGFEDRLLEKAMRAARHTQPSARRRQPAGWARWGWQLATAASLLLAILATAPHWSDVFYPPVAQPLARHDSATVRPVHILVQSPRQMSGATIRVTLPANVGLDGYTDIQTLQWQADISAGENRLSLPVKVGSAGVGSEILIEIEYQGARKVLHLPVTPASGTGAVESITRT